MTLKAGSVCVLILLTALVSSPRAFGLATEHIGNEPVPRGWGFDPGVLPLVNATNRVCWYEVNGDARFFFAGDTAALNEALRLLATLGKGREVVFLPGPFVYTSFDRKHKLPCEWEFHVPGGIHLGGEKDGELVSDKEPALYVYLAQPRSAAKPEAKQVARWMADLESDDFTVREQAAGELEKQGNAVERTLRAALAGKVGAEARRRIGVLLEKMPRINLDLVRVPEGVRVLGPDDLLARRRKALRSDNAVVHGVAVSLIADHESDPARAVDFLMETLKSEKNEYIRRSAAGSLQRLGKHAEPALPVLKEGLRDPDVNIKNCFQGAITAIESAKAEPANPDRIKKQQAIREDIARFLREFKAMAKE